MKYFIDSANPEKIARVMEYYPVSGVTTNPTILSRENADLKTRLKELRSLTEGLTLFVQVTEKTRDMMTLEAEKICDFLGGDIIIKIPATEEGLGAVKALSKKNIKTTATAVYTVQQALLSACAGASFVAPYISHIDNMCIDSVDIASQMAELFRAHGLNTEVLAASFRVAEQINRVIISGVSAVTIAPEMFPALMSSRQTDAELDSFTKNWGAVYNKTIGDYLK